MLWVNEAYIKSGDLMVSGELLAYDDKTAYYFNVARNLVFRHSYAVNRWNPKGLLVSQKIGDIQFFQTAYNRAVLGTVTPLGEKYLK